MAEELAVSEEEATESPEEERGAGPGFFLGLLLGTLAGAAAAVLFAPSTGEELHHVAEEAGPVPTGEGGAEAGTPVERIRGALDRVRSRVQQASEEAQAAAQEAEEQKRARYSELTQQ